MKLTWDDDDPERNQVTRRTLTRKEIDEADFKTYLASSSEDESDTEASTKSKAASRDRLRAMLLGGQDDLPEGWARDDDDDTRGDVDMEVTFTPGLTGPTEDRDETTLKKYQRKMREKKKQRKEGLKEKGDTKGDDPEDEFFEVDAAALPRNVKREKTTKAPERVVSTPQELSLLVSNGNAEPKHFNMKAVMMAEKKLKKKPKKDRKKFAEDEAQEDFTLDPTDERFKILHDDHNFAIDPSNPQYVNSLHARKM